MFLGAIRCFQHLCIKYTLTSNDKPGAWVLCAIKCVLLTVRTPGPMKNIKKISQQNPGYAKNKNQNHTRCVL